MAAAQRPRGVRPAAVVVAVWAALLAAPSASSQAQPLPPSPAAAAPGPAGGADPACVAALLNVSDCLPYVGQGSTARRPDRACCPELAALVGSTPVCLCALLSGAAESFGVAIDYARALALPGACRVATPPVSACAALGYHVRVGPAAAPASTAPAPGVAPSGEGPQFPGTSPFASPPSSANANHAARGLSSGGQLAALAMLPLAAAAVSGML